MMFKTKNQVETSGFTIVELMIATTVLSVILLLVTVIMLSIGHLYTKGINQANLQDSARTVIDDIAQNLQLSNGSFQPAAPSGSYRAFCVGSTRYTYALGLQASPTQHAIWRDDASGTCTVSAFTTGNEMVGPHARVTALSVCDAQAVPDCVSPKNPPYTITVHLAYGDNDLLCDSGSPSDCSNTATSGHLWNPTPPVGDILCKGQTGGEFCAVANLVTTVVPRIE